MTTALAGKEPTITAGTTAQYYKGNKSWATLDTAAVAENTNLYFTNARADARITAVLIDEDNMATNSATRLPSQQSVKAYVDAQTHDSGIDDIVEDTTPQLGGDLDANSKAITGVKRLEIVDGTHTGSSFVISNSGAGHQQAYWALNGNTWSTDPGNYANVEIFVGGTGSTRMTPCNYNDVAMLEIDVVAVNTGSNSESAAWKYKCFIRNNAGTATVIGNITEEEINPQANWSVALGVNGSNLTIQVTGESNKSINWTAFVKTTQADS
jgi:hypothetical protein